jgi:hypothetical protein
VILAERFKTSDDQALAHCLAALDGKKPPTERLMFPAGDFVTTKGTFLFDAEAAKMVMADWAEWTGGLSQKGSADYEHDQTKDNIPGHQKIDSAAYDLDLHRGALWSVNINWTAMAAQMIGNGEKRFTSPWWLYQKADKRICRFINFGLVSLPATIAQPELMAAAAGGVSVQVPESFAGYYEIGACAASRDSMDAAALIENALAGAVPHKKFDLDTSASWDGDAARKRMLKWAGGLGAKYAEGFAYVKGDGSKESDYLLPHHDVKDGHLVTVWGGLKAAAGRLDQADIPEKDLPKVKAHLAAHYREFGKIAPWERKSKAGAELPQRFGQSVAASKSEDWASDKEAEAAADAAAEAEPEEGTEKDPTKVQSLIFDKDAFTEEQAVAWAKKHDFSAAKVDETEHSFRLRQQDPKLFKKGSFRTISLTDGVKAVIGHKKAENMATDYRDKNFNPREHAYALRYMASAAMENMMSAIRLHDEVPMMSAAMGLPEHCARMAEHVSHTAAALVHHMKADDMGEGEPDGDEASRMAAKLPAELRSKVEKAIADCKAAHCGGLLAKATKAALASVGAKLIDKTALAALASMKTLHDSAKALTGEESPLTMAASIAAIQRDMPALKEQAKAAEVKAKEAEATAKLAGESAAYDKVIAEARTAGKILKGADEEWVRANVLGLDALKDYVGRKRAAHIASTTEQGAPGNVSAAVLASQTPEQRKAVIASVELSKEEVEGWAKTGGGEQRFFERQEARAVKVGLVLAK